MVYWAGSSKRCQGDLPALRITGPWEVSLHPNPGGWHLSGSVGSTGTHDSPRAGQKKKQGNWGGCEQGTPSAAVRTYKVHAGRDRTVVRLSCASPAPLQQQRWIFHPRGCCTARTALAPQIASTGPLSRKDETFLLSCACTTPAPTWFSHFADTLKSDNLSLLFISCWPLSGKPAVRNSPQAPGLCCHIPALGPVLFTFASFWREAISQCRARKGGKALKLQCN